MKDVSDTAAGNNVIASYAIMNGSEDVTDNYAVTPVAGTLTIKPAPVTITAASEAFTYDGREHRNSDYQVDGLIGDDAIEATIGGMILFPSQSPVRNDVLSYTFTSGKAENYAVETVRGKLTMNQAKASITIKAADDTVTFDGKKHKANEVTVTAGELLHGDTLVAEATGEVRNVADTKEGNNPIAEGYRIVHGEERLLVSEHDHGVVVVVQREVLHDLDRLAMLRSHDRLHELDVPSSLSYGRVDALALAVTPLAKRADKRAARIYLYVAHEVLALDGDGVEGRHHQEVDLRARAFELELQIVDEHQWVVAVPQLEDDSFLPRDPRTRKANVLGKPLFVFVRYNGLERLELLQLELRTRCALVKEQRLAIPHQKVSNHSPVSLQLANSIHNRTIIALPYSR